MQNFQAIAFISRQTYKEIKPIMQGTEVVARIGSVKKVFLEISQNSEDNTFARVSFLTKLEA